MSQPAAALPAPGGALTPAALNRAIVRLAVPAVLENLLSTAVLFVDTLLVGRLNDPAALAAVGLSSSFLWIAQGIFMAVGVGALALVARAWGEGDRAEARRLAGQSITFSAALSAGVMLVMMLLAEPFLRALLQDPDPAQAERVLRMAVDYSHVMLSTAVLAYPRLVMSAVMRAAGDTRTPMWITLLVNAANIALAVPLIYGLGPAPALGVIGAAVATACAQALGGLISLAALVRGWTPLHLSPRQLARQMVAWDGQDVRRIWRLALPNVIESGIQRVGFITFIGIVSSLGTTAMAGHQIANAVESMAFMPAWGLAIAASTLVGQSLGARCVDIAEMATQRTAIFGVLSMVAMGALFVPLGPWLASAFGAQGEVLAQASLAVRISALELPVLALYMIYGGALRGAGDTRSPMFVSLIGAVFFRVAAVWTLAVGLGLGLAGVWLGTAVDWAGRALLMWLLYRRGAWKKLVV